MFQNLFFIFKIHHSIKNLTIFLPVFAAHALNLRSLNEYVIYFFIFSMTSSIVYLFNNVYDYEKDVINKKIKYQIDQNKKYLFYSLGIFITIFLLSYISYYHEKILLLVGFYLALSILYNLFLKKIKYIDILVLVIFHILRIYYGSIAFNVEITFYFLIFCSSVFLMISVNKRLYEIDNKFINRPYGEKDKNKIQFLQILSGSCAILSFLLFILSSKNELEFFNYYLLYFNLLLIILIIVNFLFLQKEKEQDVVIFIYKNKVNMILVISFLTLFYFNSNFV